MALSDLCLPGGRIPHDFMRTAEDGGRFEVKHFQSIRPDVTLLCKGGQELLVEFDDRLPEGIAAAKARGVYKGRKPKIDSTVVHKLRYEEKLGPADIARWLGIGRASVYRVLGKKVEA